MPTFIMALAPVLPFARLENPFITVVIDGKRRKRLQRMRWLDSITNTMDMNLSKLWKIVKDRGA